MYSSIDIRIGAGEAKSWIFSPPRPSKSGVIIYMDVFGIRPALFEIAKYVAAMGHHVLLPDLYYRLGEHTAISAKEALSTPALLAEKRRMRNQTPAQFTVGDSPFFVEALDASGATGAIATLGYCMGGGRALRAASACPARITAAASIHGGNLAVSDPASPHHHLGPLSARVYIACAGADAAFPPAQSALLIEEMRQTAIDHQFENYVGCAHGWAIPDNPDFNQRGFDRHLTRLQTFFNETLR
jgi:carboxymethylenebutenolidase